MLAATSPETQKTACMSPERVSLPGQGRLCFSLEGLVYKRLPWAHSTLEWRSFLDPESHYTKMVPGMDGWELSRKQPWARQALAGLPAPLLPPAQEGRHPLLCEDTAAAPHSVETWTHPPRRNHSPRSPWQMSVLVAPPRINLGSLTMSCNSETEKLLIISKEK